VLGVLDGGAVGGDGMWMWLPLGFVGRFVSKSDCSFFSVARHGQMYLAVFVVPIQCKAEVSSAVPISVHFVILL
jgi:hypothetical protein